MLYTSIFCTHVFVYTIWCFSKSDITFLFILFLCSSSPHTSLFPDIIKPRGQQLQPKDVKKYSHSTHVTSMFKWLLKEKGRQI
jgi:hypothetical protein